MTLMLLRLSTILNSGILFVALALVGISPAALYFTIHGAQLMEDSWPARDYTWYRGPSNDMNTKHKIHLTYEPSNEPMIIAAGVLSALGGFIGAIGFFLAGKTSKPVAQKSTLFLQVVPAAVVFIVTFIAFVYTQTVFDTDNRGRCDWTQGYTPGSQLKCTHEQAACTIVGYFDFAMEGWEMSRAYESMRQICGATQTGRHLVAPLFVASLLMLAFAVGKFFAEKRERKLVESAEERVERLERQEE